MCPALPPQALQATPFIVYIVVVSILVMIMLGFQDTYGRRHVAYFVFLCSLIGSITVLSCKGVSTFLNLWLCCGAPSPFTQPVLYPLMFVLAATAILQIRYLNEAMEHFGNTETVPTYYVLFTLTTIVGSNVLYRDFENAGRAMIILFSCGCVLTFSGVKLLTSRRSKSSPPTLQVDDKSVPMLADAHDPLGGGGQEDEEASSGAQPPLRGAPAGTGRVPLNPMHHDPDYGHLQPLSFLNSPMGMSGEVIRRTFSSFSAFTERASGMLGLPAAPAAAEIEAAADVGHGAYAGSAIQPVRRSI
jgi:hypothetical protein